MSKFRIFPKAVDDLDGIADYTKRTHGDRQCALYLGQLFACFARLGETPVLERACDAIRPGLKRQKQGHHLVFYLREDDGVSIVRVLHERMDHEQHDFAGDEDEV